MKNKGITEESVSLLMWLSIGVAAVVLMVYLALVYYGHLPAVVIFG